MTDRPRIARKTHPIPQRNIHSPRRLKLWKNVQSRKPLEGTRRRSPNLPKFGRVLFMGKITYLAVFRAGRAAHRVQALNRATIVPPINLARTVSIVESHIDILDVNSPHPPITVPVCV